MGDEGSKTTATVAQDQDQRMGPWTAGAIGFAGGAALMGLVWLLVWMHRQNDDSASDAVERGTSSSGSGGGSSSV